MINKNKNFVKPIKDTKLKSLAPTLRQKKRFVRVQILANKKFNFNELNKLLSDKILYFLGAIDYSNGGVWFLGDKFNFEKQEIIIRISTKMKAKLLACLLLIKEINNINITIKILRVSGTLKGVMKD